MAGPNPRRPWARGDFLLAGRVAALEAGGGYGELYADAAVAHTADSVVVTNGTITSGVVKDTRTIDQIYLDVQESGKFEIAFTFSGLSTIPVRANFVGYYDGNPAHDVFLEIYDYVGAAWDRVTAAATDFPDGSAEYSLQFDLPQDAKYLSTDECQVRIRHDSVAVGAHHMFTDFIEVIELGLSMPMAGTEYLLSGFSDGSSRGVTLNSAAGSMTVDETGIYLASLNGSFEGLADAVISAAVYVNDVRDRGLFRRKLGAGGDVGNAGGSAVLSLTADDVLTIKVSADITDAYITIYTGSFQVHKI